jgi:hypothetical protein
MYEKRLIMFESRFSEELDDYEASYKVYLMPDLSPEEIKDHGANLSALATGVVGQVPVNRSMFDKTLRNAVSEDVLARLNLKMK